VRFHNGEPVTADDVKFSWDRYKGASAKLLKDKIKEVQVVACVCRHRPGILPA
jgi:peptide/nickel transport system substrate-binding protein